MLIDLVTVYRIVVDGRTGMVAEHWYVALILPMQHVFGLVMVQHMRRHVEH